ncbi:metallophosphoesterase [Sphingomonas sp.]|uniref:metallophosphoesterase n=1 Tax=Sphingomonas sp. TaxID=28214 RepID=UPI001DAC9C12|nr:metallophosphoesterase [Sphingomonas sp.]MBX9797360.1 metallophosphoesterase [Sphingomonas sp.]
MLKLLKKVTSRAPQPGIPAGQRVYAIGDIHGRRDLLDQLLELIQADDAARGPAQQQLIFLGDLVDRGIDSAAVVERAIEIAGALPETRFLMGNHEEVFLLALAGDLRALKMFCRIGGRETILSYGLSEDAYNALDYEELLERLPALVPAAHRAFLERFEDLVVIGDYAFVHAGIRPGVPLAEQKVADLRWIREPFLDHRQLHERVIVHGHSISEAAELTPARIGIDTGAYMSGVLTALGLEGSARWLVNT